MPEVEEDLTEGLSLSWKDGKPELSRTFHCKDLEGGNPVAIFASSLTLTSGGASHSGGDVPEEGESLVVNGVTVFANDFSVEPWPPADATVKVRYSTHQPASNTFDMDGFFSAAQISGGTSLQQFESDFDAANLALAFSSRVPMKMTYSGSISQPNGGVIPVQAPRLEPNSTFNFTRIETTDPSGRSRDFAGKRNSGTFLGMAAKTVLMLSITFSSNDGGLTYSVTYSGEYDPIDKHNTTTRYIDPNTGEPPYDISVGNGGYAQWEMQDTADFDTLAIVLA